jgi:hypothetical protein
MSHARDQLADAFAGKLVSMTTVPDAQVFRDEVYDQDVDEAIVVRQGPDEVLEEEDTLGLDQKRAFLILAECIARRGHDASPSSVATANTIEAEVQAKVMADLTLGGLCIVYPAGTERVEVSGEQQKPVASRTAAFRCVYRVNALDPTTILPSV